jgi:hypothetical protein
MPECEHIGVVISLRKRRWFGGYTDSWEGRCLICDQTVTKYDHTKEESAKYVREHIRKEHPDAHFDGQREVDPLGSDGGRDG